MKRDTQFHYYVKHDHLKLFIIFFSDGDSSKKMKMEKKKMILQERPAMNGSKTKKKMKVKDAETKSEVVSPSDTDTRLNEETSVNDESCKIVHKQSPTFSHDQKPKGVSALKEKKSGVVAIKRVKKKGKHKTAVGDVFDDISCQLDVGSGVGSSW